ncbi:MAG: hypothetical protein K5874_07265 [Bacteroidaceae bacterium]|nr:hypothetical protein [Bacteroidaceae bacterium]
MKTEFVLHIILSLISLTGLIVYYNAFVLGYKKYNGGIDSKSTLPERLYFMSTYPALIWYVLPFIKQPRMSGVFDWFDGNFTFYNIIYVVLSLSIFVFFFCVWGKKSVSKNVEATKTAFYAPSKLLTDGIYARVQHPMIIGDILGHFALVLLAGGIYSTILFPVYILIDICMIRIQSKYSLEPYFESELREYRKKTPSLLDKKLSLVLILMILLLFSNILINKNLI